MVSKSTNMFKVDDEANPWMVWISVVMVLSRVPGLMGRVVTQGEALQVMKHAHAKVMGHILTNAFGVIVVNVGGQGTQKSNNHVGKCGQGRNVHLVVAVHPWAQHVGQPRRHFVVAHNIVDDDLQGPRGGKTHRRFHQHGK